MKDAAEINKRIWVKIKNIAQYIMAFNIARAAGDTSLVDTLGSLPTPNFKMLGAMGNRLNSFKEATDIGAFYSGEANEKLARGQVKAANRLGRAQDGLAASQTQSNLLGTLGSIGGSAFSTFGPKLFNNNSPNDNGFGFDASTGFGSEPIIDTGYSFSDFNNFRNPFSN
jgi:hypothetical protein